ncbi:DUF1800 domain-containing protein [Sphingomonas colocasiae]|uniref:DUF1800 domain-containing protein n=1 Tax=Sphingomonas colocasiae TaxID=1848973 RepID=A0ABS7PX81_9SPHN|nr:DUF1800 domain-containing protein [Sphingomonas colocasiae]MBY8825970.1 DUF1800 domain-containing protein [Sphingomonas colocasiae]
MESAIALNRFGLGARPDDAQPAQPRAWLKDQLRRFEPRPATLADIPTRAEIASVYADHIEELRVRNTLKLQSRSMDASGMAPKPGEQKPPPQYALQAARRQHVAEIGARMGTALVSQAPFAERLVHFWANHFAISADRLTAIGLSGMLEFEAIRPNLLGSFGDMLLAVERHPAMLIYLDQAQSIGAMSTLGSRAAARGGRKLGLNENLAREILELHTLGVRTGYRQQDVTELARALTGWTVAGLTRGPGPREADLIGEPGAFVFADRLHEPGPRTILGRQYPQEGEAQARAVLQDLAVHPATALHVATKLARHFVADDPPASLVDRLAAAFTASRGDLPTLYAALIDAPESWAPDAGKFKTPWDWGVSALRATGATTADGRMVVAMMQQLGQPVWQPGSPAGWEDVAASWMGPDALLRCVEAAQRLVQRVGDADPRSLAARILPGTLSPSTAQVIAQADSPAQGLALLLVSPEFLRR